MKAADDQGDRDEVDDDEDQNIREYHPRVADRERRLHELGRHAAREFILVEAQGLGQHVAVKIPAQPHGKVAGQRLLLEQTLKGDQHGAAGQHRAQQCQMSALVRPQPRRLNLGEPIDDPAEHAEEQGFEYPDRRGEQGHRQDVAPYAAGTGP